LRLRLDWRRQWPSAFTESPDARPRGTGRPAFVVGLRSGFAGRPFLVLGERLQYEISDALLRTCVGDGTKQREAATLTIDCVLARRERDVAAVASATFPNGEANQLQTVENAVGEMQL